MRMMKKAVAMAMAAMMMTSIAAPAMAAGQTYSTVTGANTLVFEKYLTMDKEANVPNAKFNYTIAAGPAQDANNTAGTMQVLAGNDANRVVGTPTIAADQARFSPTDETYETAQPSMATLQSQHSDGTAPLVDNVTLEEGKKYARKAVAIDFSGVQFKEPGIYRYVVTEKAGDGTTADGQKQLGITNDADATRILDVYVIDDDTAAAGAPRMKIQGYVLHNTEGNVPVLANGTTQQETKADGFSNDYETENLTLSKAVTGNQASRDEYFEFTVNITGAVAGTVYDVTGNFDPTTKINGINTTAHENPARLTIGADGTLTQTFWLQRDQNLTINGLAKETAYSIKENADTLNAEGYTPSAVITGDNKKGANDANNVAMVPNGESGADRTEVADDAIKADTTVAYTNAKAGTIPTGVAVALGSGFGVAALGALGVGVMKGKNRKKDEDELEEEI